MDTPARQVNQAFREYASRVPGLSIDTTPSRNDPLLITLDTIEVHDGQRGQRIGANALRTLCSLADQHGVKIDLEVSDEHGIGTADWYARNGFEWQDGFMLRNPQ